MHQDYYTLIFDDLRQMDVVKDTTIHHVVVEKIYLKRNMVKQYLFDKMHGLWTMTSIKYEGIRKTGMLHSFAFMENLRPILFSSLTV